MRRTNPTTMFIIAPEAMRRMKVGILDRYLWKTDHAFER
jgi:hypothetical protein